MSDHPSAEQLSRLIDADLPLTERAAVLDHLATCPTCAGSHARLVEAAAALRELPAVAWRPEVAAAISAHATAAPAWRRRSVSPPAALIALAIALVLAVVAALPLALLSARVAAASLAVMAPLASGSPGRLLATVVATALVAPVLVYPLARWR